MKTGVELIAEERQRQLEVERWTKEHDQQWERGELAIAGACYALPETHRSIYAGRNGLSNILWVLWPFDRIWWRPRPKNRINELMKAGALIAAEIDRLNNIP